MTDEKEAFTSMSKNNSRASWAASEPYQTGVDRTALIHMTCTCMYSFYLRCFIHECVLRIMWRAGCRMSTWFATGNGLCAEWTRMCVGKYCLFFF